MKTFNARLLSVVSLAVLPLFLLCQRPALAQAAKGNGAAPSAVVSPEAKQRLDALSGQLRQDSAMKQAAAFLYAINNGFPIRQKLPNGEVIELQEIRNGVPIYYGTSNLEAARTTGADKLWPGGTLGLNLTGSGLTLGEWDGGGVLLTHQELVGRVTQKDIPATIEDHSTHVAGTLIASGVDPNAKGMCFQGRLDAYDWNDDAAEMAAAASQGLQLSNQSYGFLAGWGQGPIGFTIVNGVPVLVWQWYGDPTISATKDYRFGFYDEHSQAFDQVAFNAPNYLSVWAAHNFRGTGPAIGDVVFIGNLAFLYQKGMPEKNGGALGYDCMPAGAQTAKNTLVIGAVSAMPNGYTSAADIVMSSFSNWGPTDDGRIKPDLVACGVDVYSCIATADNAYETMSGTSMASPNACGTLGLILQHYQNQRLATPSAAMIKALAIHSAGHAGSFAGPNYNFGWGLLNAPGAVDVINKANAGRAVLTATTLNNGSTYTVNYTATGTEPVKATIVWTDPPGTPPKPSLNPKNKMLVNDLDLRVVQGKTTGMPWVLNPKKPTAAAKTGDNTTDNVEQVVVNRPKAGQVTITVAHKGTLANGSQAFALVVTGVVQPMRTLTVQSTPVAAVTVIGNFGGTTDYTAGVPDSAYVSLTTPDTAGGLFFHRWKDLADNTLSTSSSYNFFMNGDTTVVAEYSSLSSNQRTLTIQSNPIAGVSITGTLPGATDYTAVANVGGAATLQAPLVVGDYNFVNWTDGLGAVLSADAAYAFTVSADTTIVAQYILSSPPEHTLTVQSDGASNVAVAGTYPGMTSYDVPNVPEGGLITLTAPVTADSVSFVRWKDPDGFTLSYMPTIAFVLSGNATVIAEYGDEAPSNVVKAWGLNSFGQLGDGTLTTRLTPRQTTGLSHIVQVAAGKFHSLALADDGTVWPWGDNTYGQLGDGTHIRRATPNSSIADLTHVVYIAAGAYQSFAVQSDGTLWAWGANSGGQLGDGTTTDRSAPVPVAAGLDVVKVAAGDYHTLALIRDGTVRAWGVNTWGQLGNGSNSASLAAVQVNLLTGIVQVAAGSGHSLALKSDGTVWAWGQNTWGQLGNGKRQNLSRPTQLSLTGVANVGAGSWHSLAAATSGSVWTWGQNTWGQLGDGTTANRTRPVHPASISGIVEVSGGAYHSVARGSDGRVWAWGYNRQGQLGNGSTTDRSTPAVVSSLSDAIDVAAGAWHSLAIGPGVIPPPPGNQAKWTFMVYLDADNNLESYGVDNFLQMASVGSTQDVNIVVQFDRTPDYDDRYDDWTDTHRGLVSAGDEPGASWGESIGEVDMADPNTLADFITWTKTYYPAQNYALVIWDHGNGWVMMDMASTSRKVYKAVVEDDTSGTLMNIPQLQSALDAVTGGGTRMNLIGFDACLMQMAEVAYALRTYGDVMAASEEVTPAPGWPYDTILTDLTDNPDMTAAELGTAVVNRYYEFNGDDEVSSAIDLSRMNSLATSVDQLATALINDWETDTDAIKTQAAVVMSEVTQAVIAEKHGDSWPGAHGIAIYLPAYGPPDPAYNSTNVALAQDTQWDEFLAAYYDHMWFTWVDDASMAAQRFDPYTQDNADLYDFCTNLIATVMKSARTSDKAVASATATTSSTTTTTADTSLKPAWDFSAPEDENGSSDALWTPSGGLDAIIIPPPAGPPAVAPAPVTTCDGIVDNRDQSAQKQFKALSGQWPTSVVLAGHYGADYAYTFARLGGETARCRFACTALPAGRYDVYAWWPAGKDRATHVAYEILHAEGVTTVHVDQTAQGGRWNLLGTFSFAAGTHAVEVQNGQSVPGSFLAADAVRFVPAGTKPADVTPAPASGATILLK